MLTPDAVIIDDNRDKYGIGTPICPLLGQLCVPGTPSYYSFILQHIFLHFTLSQNAIDGGTGAADFFGDSRNCHTACVKVTNPCIPHFFLVPPFLLDSFPLAEGAKVFPLRVCGVDYF